MSEIDQTEEAAIVERALNEIRPYLKKDGGNVELVEIKDDTVVVRLLGNCATCEINGTTMKLGIATTVRKYLPRIKKVINVE